MHLFRKFYYTFEAIFGSYLIKSDLEDEDTYLYLIDDTAKRSIMENTPRNKLQLYRELQDKLYDRYCDIDRTGYNYDLYEVLFTFAHNDFFFFTALLVHRENLPAH